jgi:adenylate cyclase
MDSNKVNNKKNDKDYNGGAERVRHPIGVKLIAIISMIVLVALGGVTYAVSYFVTADVRNNAEENNLTINSRTASDTENRITSALSSVAMFIDLLNTAGTNTTEIKQMENLFFARNKSIVAVYLPESSRLFVNSTYMISHELEADSALNYFLQEDSLIQKAQNGYIELQNASPFFNVPVLSFFYPAEGDVVAFLYSAEELSESFSSGSVNQSFFVNKDGTVLAHSDNSLMRAAADESSNPIVRAMQESPANNSQITYTTKDKVEYIGAFRKLSFGDCAVITTVQTAIILEGVRKTTRRNLYISAIILSLSILIIYFFSKSLSRPLKVLTAIVNEINQGNFNTELFSEIKKTHKDEIGVLANSTKHEREILNTFTKLTNKGVTQAIIKKEIDFEPHLKDITIFFSDIRGFTAISDGFKNRFGEKSAAEIISFLNDYMSRMVNCVTISGGTIDKFEGDAIMAVWGILRDEDLSFELLPDGGEQKKELARLHPEHVQQDAVSAIKGTIAMRYALMQYNKDAEAFTKAHEHEAKAKYKPHIRIGCGINTGRATCGIMGSEDKMEYTAIGDSVNFASRTESSNKPCGTDILITQDTYNLLKKDYIKCDENNYKLPAENEANEIVVEMIPVEFEVKGKGAQHFYGVVNMPNFDIEAFFKTSDKNFVLDQDCARAVGKTGPRTLNEMRNLLGIPIPEFESVNLNEEENKIQVKK